MERGMEARRSRGFHYLQDKVKKIVKKKRAISERTKLQQELDNLVGNDLQ